jgi:predicted RNA methylase
MLNLPDTILEIAQYEKTNGELPFAYSGNNWVYDAFCERQKYRGVQNSQFLTPDATADKLRQFAGKYFTGKSILEPCCGTGQISKELLKDGYDVAAFDIDPELVRLCNLLFPELIVFQSDFKECNFFAYQIIANPPYEIQALTEFLEWIDKVQNSGGLSILLLPKGFIKKERPKRTVEALNKFEILETRDMTEEFVRTKINAEIVVFGKL